MTRIREEEEEWILVRGGAEFRMGGGVVAPVVIGLIAQTAARNYGIDLCHHFTYCLPGLTRKILLNLLNRCMVIARMH